MIRGYNGQQSYDNWLDAPYNQPEPICSECGEDITGEVYEDIYEDDRGNEHVVPKCEDCYNESREKVYTFSVAMELTLVGVGLDETEALQNALDEFDVIDRGEVGKSHVLEWEYND